MTYGASNSNGRAALRLGCGFESRLAPTDTIEAAGRFFNIMSDFYAWKTI